MSKGRGPRATFSSTCRQEVTHRYPEFHADFNPRLKAVERRRTHESSLKFPASHACLHHPAGITDEESPFREGEIPRDGALQRRETTRDTGRRKVGLSIYDSRQRRLLLTAAPFCGKGPGRKNRTNVSRKSVAIARTPLGTRCRQNAPATSRRRRRAKTATRRHSFFTPQDNGNAAGCFSLPFPRPSFVFQAAADVSPPPRVARLLAILGSPCLATQCRRHAENDDRDTPSLRAAPFFRPFVDAPSALRRLLFICVVFQLPTYYSPPSPLGRPPWIVCHAIRSMHMMLFHSSRTHWCARCIRVRT